MSLHHSIIRHLLTTPMSLADLQLATQVSLPTLRRAVQELSDAHWIRVVGQAEANGGRPAMLFGVDDSLFAIVGVHLQLPGIRLILADLNGQVLDACERFDSIVPTPEEVVQAVAAYVTHLKATQPARQILGIGVGAPGFIDLSNGDILSIGRVPAWGSFPICRRLQAALALPVYIANDVDCMAFAELHATHAPRGANLAYVGFDEGVKISLFLKGELYKGTLGNAGLTAAHLLHIPGLALSTDAARLLTINGADQIFAERLATLTPTDQMLYGDLLPGSPRERVQQLLARTDLPLCRALAEDQIAVLAVTLATATLLVQPDVIVIGGLLSALPGDLFAALEASVRGYLPGLVSHNTVIQQGKHGGESSGALGATHHFLHSYLASVNGELV